ELRRPDRLRRDPGLPLTASLVTRLVGAVRERAWGSFEVATGAALVAALLLGQALAVQVLFYTRW
ncbi:MAG TPA: hypothetical protein VFX88_10685, partial [Actinomycetota bacterium]|nr:hypothetical protein [Actinomycetota bacterium]